MAQHKQIIERYRALQTAIICDVYDENGWPVQALDYRVTRQTSEKKRIAGYAYPIEGAMQHQDEPDRLKLQVVDQLPEDTVTVWAGTDARGICLFGDLIAATMQQRGCRGAVVDGGFRDSEEISGTGFPVFARYTTPVQAVGRWKVTRYNEPVELPGATGETITVSPGDMILADEDGVVAVEQERILAVLKRAEDIVQQEEEARQNSAGGMSASEMLDRYGHV